jgi:uncharacterized membrane protein
LWGIVLITFLFFNIGVLWHMLFEKLNGFQFSRGSYVNLSPLLSLAVGNRLDHFPLSKIDVLWHFFLESSVVFLC